MTTYNDIRDVFDQAIIHNGGKVRCADYGQAVRWRQRAYAWRAGLKRKALEEWKDTPMEGRTAYDSILLRLERGSNIVHIIIGEPPVEFEPNAPLGLGE